MNRTIFHYLLLTLAIIFFVEEFFFLATALGHAGRDAAIAKRFLIVTLGVFLTAVVALVAYLRTVRRPGTLVIALLVVQPAIGAAANAIAGLPVRHAAVPIVSALAAVVLLVFVAGGNIRR